MKNSGRRIATLLAGAVVFSTLAHTVKPDEPKNARYYRQQAAAAYKAKNYALAAENFTKALDHDQFVSPQGLSFSEDERHLFMADYSTGLFDIDVTTRKVAHLPPVAGATLLGIDGLYFHKGSLIGVQNGVTPQRVVRIHLSTDLTRATRLEVIETNNPVFDEPTLGVLVKDEFYFVANSQWGSVSDKGELAGEDKLRDPIILKMKLQSTTR